MGHRDAARGATRHVAICVARYGVIDMGLEVWQWSVATDLVRSVAIDMGLEVGPQRWG